MGGVVTAGDAALPGVACDAAEGGVVEVGAEGHAETAEGVVGAEGDLDGIAAVGGLLHFDVDLEGGAEVAGVSDGGFSDADRRLEQRVADVGSIFHGEYSSGAGAGGRGTTSRREHRPGRHLAISAPRPGSLGSLWGGGRGLASWTEASAGPAGAEVGLTAGWRWKIQLCVK